MVYDESGTQIETIPGCQFASGAVINPPPALNPSRRMGCAFAGSGDFSQLQQFYY